MPRDSQRGRALAVTGELLHCHWRDLAEHVRRTVGQVDALIVDAPYSERTHSGHDGAAAADPGKTWKRSNGREEAKIERREIDYEPWTTEHVSDFVSTWVPITRGWIVSITDDVLAAAWRAALESAGRQTFQSVPCVIRGMSVRLVGDGPSSWATHAIVGRPRTKEMARWGTLDGAYVGPCERQPVVGGKPLWLMESLVRDYTRPGDLVCDPCMGAGTTLLAAKLLGRQYIGGDLDAKHVEIARERLRDLPAQPKAGTLALPWEKP